ncbi:MAG: hypothetical protein IJI05_00905 [Erysipelotrichaceae bacterium]|nr:hypothetical protein [Erysipelotrichaceae bacterium]
MKKGYFAGLCNLDIIYYDDHPLPEEDTKGKYSDYTWAPGGPATNAALTYAFLRGEATLITALGTSQLAVMIRRVLEAGKVKVIDLADDERAVSISSIHVNTSAGTRTILSGQNPFLPDMSMLPEIRDAAFIEYDGSLPGIEEHLLKAGCDIVLDMGSDKESFLKCFSERTTAISSEAYCHDGKDIFELKNSDVLACACRSRGRKPLQYSTEGETGEISVMEVNAVDTLGAGDILHGAYCYYRYDLGLDLKSALKKAADFASLSTEVRGVAEGMKHAAEVMIK